MSDNLIVYQNHNVALPPGLSKQDINDITLHGKWAWASLFKPKAIGATMGSGLLATVTHYLQDGSEQQKPLKYVLLSGHDSSILSLLSAMQVALDEPPPYASVLNFSVFETKNRGKKIVASLNDKPIFIPHCKGSSCTPAQFSQLLAHSKDHIDTQALAAIHAEDRTQARVH
jgi:acid phosphatase